MQILKVALIVSKQVHSLAEKRLVCLEFDNFVIVSTSGWTCT